MNIPQTTPAEAFETLKKHPDAVYLDVRTEGEFEAGHPAGARNVPVLTLDPATRDPLWDLRRASLPLLYSLPGAGKPVTFVEDCAVAPERLPEFVRRYRRELAAPGAQAELVRLTQEARQGTVTLVFSTRDVDLSGAKVLASLIEELYEEHPSPHRS